MALPKRSELKDFNIDRDITVSRDGDTFCALFGKEQWSGQVGFGGTEIEALKKLNEQLGFNRYSDAKVFWVSEND